MKEGLSVFFALFGTLALLAVVATARECMAKVIKLLPRTLSSSHRPTRSLQFGSCCSTSR